MKVLGIIAEYNPMHNGHIYHIQKAKEITKCDYTILVISGSFTQAGNISTINKFDKAKIAVQNGVDLVIEIPTIYATSSSEYFAKGAIKLLNELNIVDYICFGAECNNISTLKSISNKLIQNNNNNILKEINLLGKNNTFAKNRSTVLKKYINKDEIEEIDKPNNILAIEYIKSLINLNSNIEPICISRCGDISSSKIRESLFNNNLEYLKNNVPLNVFENIQKNYILNSDIYKLLRYIIISKSTSDLSKIYEVAEGLENKLKKEVINSSDYSEFIKNVKSKRYTEARIKRICINILLNITKKEYDKITKDLPVYAHVLSINNNSKELLSSISKNSNIPVLVSLKKNAILNLDIKIKKLLDIDIYASNIYSILASSKINTDLTNKLL